MNNRSISNSRHIKELKKKKYVVLQKKMIIITFSILILFIGIIFLSRIKSLNINNIQISGNKIIENKEIEEIINKNIAGHYLYFIPKTNFLFYPNKKINQELITNFKRIKDISLTIKDFKNLEINIIEREAKYIWCGDTLPDINLPINNALDENKCSFMDENGYIFDTAPYFSDNVYLKFYGKINFDIFQKLISFIENIKNIKVKPSFLYFKEDGDLELYLIKNSETMLAPKIIFNKEANFDKLINNLQTALDTEPLKNDFRKKYSSLLYIDLRFGNKVYYKFK